MRRFLLSCGLAATCLSGGFASESDPSTMVSETIKALRANDYAKAISSIQGSLDQARATWDAARAMPASPEEEAQINQTLMALTNPEMLEMMVQHARAIAPTHNPEEMAQGLGMLPLMMMGITGGNPEIASAPEIKMVLGMIPEIQGWIEVPALDNPDIAEQTVRTFAAGVQKLGITSIDDIRALEFDDLLTKVSSLTATIKEIGLTYDLAIDSFLDSVDVSSGSDNTLNVKMTMFGKERELSIAMVEHNGSMLPKIVVDIRKAQMAAPVPEAPALP